MKHVTKFMIVRWNIGVFILEEKYFQQKQKQKKGSVFYSFKTPPVNKLKQTCHILETHF